MTEPEAEGIVDDVKTEETAQAEPEAEEIVAISIGEPPPQAEPEEPAPAWVKEVRKTNREQAKKIRELESQLKAPQAQAAVSVLPKKPTLESHDYDEVKFESALSEWFDVKRKVDDAERSAKAKADDETKTVQERHKNYKQQLRSLRLKLKLVGLHLAGDHYLCMFLSLFLYGIIYLVQ